MSYNIAIIGSYNFHYECVGFLCEILLKNPFINKDIHINIFYLDDHFGYLKYFKQLYPSIDIYNNIDIKHIESNDLIIKLTSNDPILYNANIISILHYFPNKDISTQFITISPFVSNSIDIIPFNSSSLESYLSNTELNYIFPLYSGIYCPTYNNIILVIGYFIPNFLDSDLDKFIMNSNYTFYFFSYMDLCFLQKYKNVKSFRNGSTSDLITYIGECKFILCRHKKYMNCDRFSGALSLAMSHRKPIILSDYESDIYNIPSITYKENYSELTEYLNTISDEEYVNQQSRIDEFIKIQDEYNKRKMCFIINSK